MRFVAYNHYVHKVFRRWGPNFRELLAIRRYLEQHAAGRKGAWSALWAARSALPDGS